MTRQSTRIGSIVRSAVVLSGMLGASLAGAGGAEAAISESDLVAKGGTRVSALGEIGPGHLITSGVGNIGLRATSKTDARFTLRPVARISLNGTFAYINRPGTTTITVNGSTPALGAFGTAQANAILATGQYVPGLTEVTVCVDASNTVREASETNNCAKEIRTL